MFSEQQSCYLYFATTSEQFQAEWSIVPALSSHHHKVSKWHKKLLKNQTISSNLQPNKQLLTKHV